MIDFIQGERFIGLANNVDIFYRHTHDVNMFFKNQRVFNDFILISHNSDGCVTDNLENPDSADSRLMPSNLVHWYAQNVNVVNDRIESIPIGLENSQWFPEVQKRQKMIMKLAQPRNIKNLVYANHNIGTNLGERLVAYQLLEGKPWATIGRGANGCGFDEYLDNIYHHQFVVCPDGHGIDTHRVWETLYMGSIPVQRRGINNQFYKDLPICFVNSWEEVTEDFLNVEYKRISEQLWNLEKLNFSYWSNKILNYDKSKVINLGDQCL
jgi:hypothetical protein